MTASSNAAAPPPTSPEEAARITRRITLISCGVAAVLLVAKAAAWMASGSVAMLASMADSGLDLLASLLTAAAVRYAAAPPDAEHRFGHGKAEALASLVQSALVFVSALVIVYEAALAVLHPRPLAAEGPALMVMGLSILLTLGLVTLQTRALRQAASVAVAGDRAHYASDLASNLASLAGLAAAAVTGIIGFDALAGLIVAGVLVWSALGVFREAANQLLDREMDDADRARIIEIVCATPGVEAVSELRTRASGPHQHIQLRAQFAAEASLMAAHEAILEAENRLLVAFPAADILIHPDPGARAPAHQGAFAAPVPDPSLDI